MATNRGNDLMAFTSFAVEQLSNSNIALTLEEALALWEYENQTEAEREDTLQSVRRGLADVEADRVKPAREAMAELRRKYHLTALP